MCLITVHTLLLTHTCNFSKKIFFNKVFLKKILLRNIAHPSKSSADAMCSRSIDFIRAIKIYTRWPTMFEIIALRY